MHLHLDSHHHIHTDLSIFREIKPLFQKYNFSSIRLSKNVNISGSLLIVILKNVYKNVFNSLLIKMSKRTTDYFCDFSDFINQRETIEKKINNDSILELMCHPDYIDGKLKNLWTETGDGENFELVTSYLKKNNLISFGDL